MYWHSTVSASMGQTAHLVDDVATLGNRSSSDNEALIECGNRYGWNRYRIGDRGDLDFTVSLRASHIGVCETVGDGG